MRYFLILLFVSTSYLICKSQAENKLYYPYLPLVGDLEFKNVSEVKTYSYSSLKRKKVLLERTYEENHFLNRTIRYNSKGLIVEIRSRSNPEDDSKNIEYFNGKEWNYYVFYDSKERISTIQGENNLDKENDKFQCDYNYYGDSLVVVTRNMNGNEESNSRILDNDGNVTFFIENLEGGPEIKYRFDYENGYLTQKTEYKNLESDMVFNYYYYDDWKLKEVEQLNKFDESLSRTGYVYNDFGDGYESIDVNYYDMPRDGEITTVNKYTKYDHLGNVIRKISGLDKMVIPWRVYENDITYFD